MPDDERGAIPFDATRTLDGFGRAPGLYLPNDIRYKAGMTDKEFVAATTAPLVLSMLRNDDSYGYELIQKVCRLTNGRLEWTEAMLYPVLHRLEDRDWVVAHWRSSGSGRKRKYYSITQTGERALGEKLEQWRFLDTVLKNVSSDFEVLGGR